MAELRKFEVCYSQFNTFKISAEKPQVDGNNIFFYIGDRCVGIFTDWTYCMEIDEKADRILELEHENKQLKKDLDEQKGGLFRRR